MIKVPAALEKVLEIPRFTVKASYLTYTYRVVIQNQIQVEGCINAWIMYIHEGIHQNTISIASFTKIGSLAFCLTLQKRASFSWEPALNQGNGMAKQILLQIVYIQYNKELP